MLPVLAVIGAALCFSTTGTAQALGHTGASPVAVGAARILIGGVLLAGLGFSGRATSSNTQHPRVPTWAVIALGAAGVLTYQPTFFLGTASNGVALGTVVTLGSAPIATGILDAIRSRRAPGSPWLVATGLAILGVVLVSGVLGADLGQMHPNGLLASVLAGISYGTYTIAAKVLIDRGWAPRRAMAALFGSAGVASLPILLIAGAAWITTPRGLVMALWLGLITTAAAYILFGWGLARLPATTVATLTLAEPLSATILGLVVLNEHLGMLEVLGIALIATALVLVGSNTNNTKTVVRDVDYSDNARSDQNGT